MAVTVTELTQGDDVSSPQNTASITPTANRLVLALVVDVLTGGVAPTVTLSGNGLTWVEVATILWQSDQKRVTLFRAMGASPTAGVVTLTFSAAPGESAWAIAEFAGVKTGGTNGSEAVVQSATFARTTGGQIITVTLGAFASGANATFGGFSIGSNSDVYSPGAGFTAIQEQPATGMTIKTEWRSDNDTTVDVTWTNTSLAAGIAVEIAALPSGRSFGVILG